PPCKTGFLPAGNFARLCGKSEDRLKIITEAEPLIRLRLDPKGRRLSRANTSGAIPKRATSGGSSLEGRSQGRSSTGHYQRANSFGPNELRAIATSGDKRNGPFGQGFPS